jgi:diketogulonate reductase-like aldo/keto reductase
MTYRGAPQSPIRHLETRGGAAMPVLGLGTFRMGEDTGRRAQEIASRTGTIEAAERSLRRLGTDRIDLYLLHWKSQYPLEETLEAFDQLVREQKTRYFGVSNFTASDMRRAES